MNANIQDTAEMHSALKASLSKAINAIEDGQEIPWSDLEAAVNLAIKHGVATADDLNQIRERNLPVARLKELLRRVIDRYGNSPTKPRIM
jgi:hypothetical protein